MTRAEQCRLLAAKIGWSRAYLEVYGIEDTTAKEYASRLRDSGWSVRDIVVACRLRFGIGSNAWVLLNTDPEQYKKHLARNKKYARSKRQK